MKNRENLIILLGPTAVGKTKISIDLAKEINGEIISADSMQIYKYMNIGSAKVTKEEMSGIEHHLIDFLYPNEEFTVANYKKLAENLILDINKKNKIPIVAGGTGLYINSLVYNLNFAQVAPNEEIRFKLEAIAKEKGNDILHEKLKTIDEVSASKINPNDQKRVVRALEIYEITGKTMSEYNKDFRSPVEDYNLVMIGLNMNRAKLYERINFRVDIMIEEGLVEEVKYILSLGYDKNLVSMQGIGYKEIIMYLDGEITLNKSIELIKQKSRNYAKRQLTWFRRDKRIKWIDLDEYSDISLVTQDIVDCVKKTITVL